MLRAQQYSMISWPSFRLGLFLERRSIADPFEPSSLILLQDLERSSSKDGVESLLRKNNFLAFHLGQYVRLVGMNRHSQVRGQGPWRRCPDQNRLSRPIYEWESHEDREVLYYSILV